MAASTVWARVVTASEVAEAEVSDVVFSVVPVVPEAVLAGVEAAVSFFLPEKSFGINTRRRMTRIRKAQRQERPKTSLLFFLLFLFEE